jgi:hypothetical protein
MPSYIKTSVKLSFNATQHNMVKSGEATPEQAWVGMKNKFPLYTGHGNYTPEHEEYTRAVISVINNNSADGVELELLDKGLAAGTYVYVENLEHDEDIKGISFNIVQYFKDQDVYDKVKAEFDKTNAYNREGVDPNTHDYTIQNVNFHKPYKEV